jgi:hypothetical protein
MEPVVVDDIEVRLDRAEILRLLGRRGETGDTGNERLEAALTEAMQLAGRLIEPKGIYTIAAGRDLPGSDQFSDLERVAFCICTIGPGIEREVTSLSEGGELLRAVVLDSVGSVAAEAVAEVLDQQIHEIAAAEGLKTSCRASPGYGDWDIREQEAIFLLLPAESIGVKLSESFMMIPRKSVSFAVDISEKPVRMRSENSCRNCDRIDCRFRILE